MSVGPIWRKKWLEGEIPCFVGAEREASQRRTQRGKGLGEDPEWGGAEVVGCWGGPLWGFLMMEAGEPRRCPGEGKKARKRGETLFNPK